MNNITSLLILFVLLISCISCNDDITFNPVNEPLPAATKTGANTFGFLLNDKTWLPYYDDNKMNPVDVEMDKDSLFMFSINLKIKKINRDESIKIFLPCTKPGNCKPVNFTFTNYNLKLGCQTFQLNTNNLTFEITCVDFVKQIISGNFEISGSISSCGNETIEITKGVFDCTFTK
jgi:hypothetical protein